MRTPVKATLHDSLLDIDSSPPSSPPLSPHRKDAHGPEEIPLELLHPSLRPGDSDGNEVHSAPQATSQSQGSSRSGSPSNDAGSDSPQDDGELSFLASKRKRTVSTDDTSQLIESLRRHIRLKTASVEQLTQFAKLSPIEQGIFLAGTLLKVTEQLEAHNSSAPSEDGYQIPTTLSSKMECYANMVLLSPLLGAYVTEPTTPADLVIKILERHPQYGLTAEVKNNSVKHDKIFRTIQSRCTALRSTMKKQVWASLGKYDQSTGKFTGAQDIVSFTKALAASAAKRAGKVTVVVTVQLCARFAYIRETMVTEVRAGRVRPDGKDKFWEKVDANLKAVRDKYDGHPKVAQRITQVFTKALDRDYETFGHSDEAKDLANSLSVTSVAQKVSDAATIGEDVREDQVSGPSWSCA
ncbi:hypothetical protein K474DRAFT_1774793 [Panus rudis PR-1116 ss-1]|nr:hypothetical protein K474DRAFT_1702553 [Panus rudis PR-1116 ss-1]KAI0073336.1 hypothetical protein K474DRAFT_1774793 [Panus rudis PR-1116 ss-1]